MKACHRRARTSSRSRLSNSPNINQNSGSAQPLFLFVCPSAMVRLGWGPSSPPPPNSSASRVRSRARGTRKAVELRLGVRATANDGTHTHIRTHPLRGHSASHPQWLLGRVIRPSREKNRPSVAPPTSQEPMVTAWCDKKFIDNPGRKV
jgi:hypothetical protein